MENGRWTAAQRQQWMDEHVDDDSLIDFATTCSNAGVRLAAEMQLRRRYPSRNAAKMLNATKNKNAGLRAGRQG